MTAHLHGKITENKASYRIKTDSAQSFVKFESLFPEIFITYFITLHAETDRTGQNKIAQKQE